MIPGFFCGMFAGFLLGFLMCAIMSGPDDMEELPASESVDERA